MCIKSLALNSVTKKSKGTCVYSTFYLQSFKDFICCQNVIYNKEDTLL